jgi:hypothetical protein
LFIFVIAYIVWFINNRILGKHLALAKVIAFALVASSFAGLVLWTLSYLVEQV